MLEKNAALITGSAKRIGKEVALFLAKKGFDIAIHYNNSKQEAQDLAQEISKKFNVKTKIFYSDLKNVEFSKELISQVVSDFPHCNLLVNNASIFNRSKFLDDNNDSEISDNFNIHFFSPLNLSWYFSKHIIKNNIKNAQIINFVDKNIVRFDSGYFYYLLSKKTLAESTKILALELAPKIRVNAIAPGFILNAVNDYNPSEKDIESLIKKIPLQQKGNVENICQSINFLLENNFITGQIIFVDGGASLNHAG